MKQIELEVGDIKPNPFKKFINKGKLDEERVAKMEESLEHGTLPMTFSIRETKKGIELSSGHHRRQAIENKKGKNFKVNCSVVDYNDETMLVDMVRENLTQRDSDFKDVEDSCVLARAWKQSDATTVKQFDSGYKSGKHIKGVSGSVPQNGSYRDIADFLSKKGKAICHETIRKYLLIHDNLDSSLHERIQKFKGTEDKEEKISIQQAILLSEFKDKKEQKDLEKAIKKSPLKHQHDIAKAVRSYKEVDDFTKKLVKKGKIGLADLLKEKTERDVEEEQAEKEISLKKAFFSSHKNYLENLLVIRQTSLEDFSTGEIERFINSIRDCQEQELKTFEFLNKFLKKKGVVLNELRE